MACQPPCLSYCLYENNVEKWIRKGTYAHGVVGEDEKYRKMEQ